MAITKTEIFKRLDRRIKKSERLELACAYDLSDYHLGIGLWIRNTWFDKTEIREVLNEKGDSMHLENRDEFSSKVLCEYQSYLRDKYKLDKYDILTPTSDLWNAMVSLDVEKCERLLRCYEIDVNMTYDGFSKPDQKDIVFNPIHTIAKAWEILTAKNEICKEWSDKYLAIKSLLSDKCGIDFSRIEESDIPKVIVKKSDECVLSSIVADLAKGDVLQNRREDVNLYIAVSIMDFETVEKLLAEGANPTVNIWKGVSALDMCNGYLESIEHFGHIVNNSAPDDYPKELMFTDWIWTLMEIASYQELLDMLNNRVCRSEKNGHTP